LKFDWIFRHGTGYPGRLSAFIRKIGMRRPFVTLDVFTDRRFAGNPLAVVLESRGLEDAGMQAAAREFNLPETVFVLPPADDRHRARLRIFTPARELPFAGHPTVGTAVLLGQSRGGEMVLEEEIGAVRCHVEPLGSDRGFARFDLPKLPERVGEAADAALIAAALGLAPAELGFAGFVPAVWSAGAAFTFVPVRDRAAVARSRPDMARWADAVGASLGVFVFCGETEDANNTFHARMFAPTLGIAEDPATGSAVAALAGLVTHSGAVGDGDHEMRIEQGYEMGRPSLIDLAISIRAGRLVAGAIGGRAIVVSDGMIEA
jgi:trans-2,3-dihydro-3-hydroxyanthranilate isomerase